MRGMLTTLSCLMLVAAPALAQQQAIKLSQHNAWGTYSHSAKGEKVCYAMTVPTQKTPADLDHGDIYFFISQKPDQNVSYEPQFIASYEFKPESKVSVTIGDNSYSMFTTKNSAWMENPSQEPQLIADMKAGAEMKISATSGRGNDTSYAFSLSGVTAALESISSCK